MEISKLMNRIKVSNNPMVLNKKKEICFGYLTPKKVKGKKDIPQLAKLKLTPNTGQAGKQRQIHNCLLCALDLAEKL